MEQRSSFARRPLSLKTGTRTSDSKSIPPSNLNTSLSIGVTTNRALLWATGLSAFLQAAIVSETLFHSVFKVVPFEPEHWLLVFGVGIIPLVGMEALKAV